MNQRIQKVSAEKSGLVERVASLQRTLANMETEKREIERHVSRQEKDKTALKKTLDKVSSARLGHTVGSVISVTLHVLALWNQCMPE